MFRLVISWIQEQRVLFRKRWGSFSKGRHSMDLVTYRSFFFLILWVKGKSELTTGGNRNSLWHTRVGTITQNGRREIRQSISHYVRIVLNTGVTGWPINSTSVWHRFPFLQMNYYSYCFCFILFLPNHGHYVNYVGYNLNEGGIRPRQSSLHTGEKNTDKTSIPRLGFETTAIEFENGRRYKFTRFVTRITWNIRMISWDPRAHV
jgi:hypothetical protein